MEKHYFDNASTTRVTNEVLKVALPYLTEYYGNPSSVHSMGAVAKNAITRARHQCAKAIGAKPEQIFFTSGSTESNNIVYRNHEYVLKSPYEHPSMGGVEISDLKIDLNKADRAGIHNGLVSHIFVQSEIGTIFPVKEYADIAHSHGWKFHTDATQAFSHLEINVKELGCDFLSLSGSKIHAPKGVGLLYVKNPEEFKSKARNISIGGGQEGGIRSGTENVFGIVALGQAMTLYKYEAGDNCLGVTFKKTLIRELAKKCPVEFRINELKGYEHVDNIVNVSFKGINSEGLSLLLDHQGFCVSTKSACKSGSTEPSPILKAIGVEDDYLFGALRISFGIDTSIKTVTMLADAICETIGKLIMIKN